MSTELTRRLRPLVLPAAMLAGIAFHDVIHYIGFLTPILLFVMLTVAFCRADWRKMKLTGFHYALAAVQWGLAWVAYGVFWLIDDIAAQGVFLCVFICTATAAPVITSMLGGSIERLLGYSLLSLLLFTLAAPLFLPLVGGKTMEFGPAALKIAWQVSPLLIGPIVAAELMRWLMPRAHRAIAGHQTISFYLWAVGLLIVMGNAVAFLFNSDEHSTLRLALLMGGSLAVCLAQFAIGRRIGRRWGDAVAGGQALGQKNTILALWIALTYLDPTASIAPGAYILWQNGINSWQLWRHRAGS